MTDKLHVFVDTNVWLAFYAFTKDDVEQLKKLVALLGKDKLKLYIPQQVVDEFYRNRERKLDESLRAFSRSEVPKSVPRYMLDYAEAAEYETSLAKWQSVRDALIARAKADAESKMLAADLLFASILAACHPIPVTGGMIDRALQRRLRGNPPGKYPSLGDQINWEVLLETVPAETDLEIVAKDGDFASKLIPGRADQFLIDEWRTVKNGNLTLHGELRPFLNAKFPGIKLAIDLEKKEAIDRLVNSGNFSQTHYAISELMPFIDDLSWPEADLLINAALVNNQIGWIGTDEDVKSFYSHLLVKFGNQIDEDRKTQLTKLITPLIFVADVEAQDPPF